jgi:hypothetical protein
MSLLTGKNITALYTNVEISPFSEQVHVAGNDIEYCSGGVQEVRTFTMTGLNGFTPSLQTNASVFKNVSTARPEKQW